jgi:alkylhydroperoxidase family enzyme
MSWLANGDDRQSLVGQLPEIAGPYFELEKSLWHQPHLPADILALCRLRLAQLHRCAAETASTAKDLPETKRDALGQWDTSGQFSAAERACLAFTEVYAMDTQALTDEHAGAVKQHFGDAGLVLLIEALGMFDGVTRLSLLWQLAPGPAADEAPT